ncbi:carbohydrate ABC transporter permease [Cohnella abietis]|uniref:ABC transporter permease n=1 Tax=Cohnella abietis TaxID=2507935 RepID=A0A3T1CXZ8_9BACL|nr:sugar ABC transporter permease [Cohnella abietis]BBI30713.1 ABC transporter permease [Cohnella abietis]
MTFKYRISRTSSRQLWAYLFIFPQVVFFLAFTVYPIVMSYVYTLYDWSGIGPITRYVGLGNYRQLFEDPLFWKSYRNSFIYMVSNVALVMPTSFLMALLLNSKRIKGVVFYRTIYFIPVISTTAIVGIIMRMIFGNDKATFNNILLALGLIDQPIPWLLQSGTAMVILILVGSWLFFGMCLVYWLAVLQSLPAEIYDAAKVDGAGFWNGLRYITIPLLIPSALVILLLNVLHSFNAFDLVMTLTGGGPFFATQTVDLYIYKAAFSMFGLPRIGYGSAAGVSFGLSVSVIAGVLGLLIRAVRKLNSTQKGLR